MNNRVYTVMYYACRLSVSPKHLTPRRTPKQEGAAVLLSAVHGEKTECARLLVDAGARISVKHPKVGQQVTSLAHTHIHTLTH